MIGFEVLPLQFMLLDVPRWSLNQVINMVQLWLLQWLCLNLDSWLGCMLLCESLSHSPSFGSWTSDFSSVAWSMEASGLRVIMLSGVDTTVYYVKSLPFTFPWMNVSNHCSVAVTLSASDSMGGWLYVRFVFYFLPWMLMDLLFERGSFLRLTCMSILNVF